MCNYFTAKRADASTLGYIYKACIAGYQVIYKNGFYNGSIGSNVRTNRRFI
jgi:hypothetical protein